MRRNRQRKTPKKKAVLDGFRWNRAYGVLFLIGVGFSLLGLRALQVHIFERAQFKKPADRNARGAMVFATRRADVTDRHGEMLATSIKSWALVANPQKVTDPRSTAHLLAPILSIDENKLVRILRKKGTFTFVDHQVSDQAYLAVTDLKQDKRTKDLMKGLWFDPDYKRVYPKRHLAAQILGWTSTDDRGYTGLELGLDRQFDKQIMGEKTRVTALRTGLKRGPGASSIALLSTVLPILQSEPLQVETTIDAGLQEKVEQILDNTVSTNFARRGAAIVYDVRTGEILSFAHAPRIDNNHRLQAPKPHRLPWGAIDVFEPGSVLKVFTIAAALESEAVTPETMIDTHGGHLRIADAQISDLKKMKQASVRDVLRYSSNVGTVEIARSTGQERLQEILVKAGFGQPTGLPIPYEAPGLAQLSRRWDPVTFANIAFGQGIAVSAIQLVRAFAAFGNDGDMLVPHLVRTVRDRKGQVVYEARRTIAERLVSPETAHTMLDLLGTVVSSGATGRRAAIQDCHVGGKTGTGQQIVKDPETGKKQYSSEAEFASFVGFVPIEKPEIAIYVVIDRPIGEQGGGAVAAPAFAKIADTCLDLLGLRPCETAGTSVPYRTNVPPKIVVRSNTPVAEQTTAPPIPGTIVVPDVRGQSLPKAAELLGYEGLHVRIIGTGVVHEQRPGAGTVVSEGTPIQVFAALQAEGIRALE
ncbi:MAG: hypothetical protein CMH54_00950 [Myxococcales bacterium]|nr:hypothetical protein [Myxococcales bacterium]|tara:strand:+ start:264 stop:2363 length:2100 start_codon:yes stop_codon:yes gene_type:complete